MAWIPKISIIMGVYNQRAFDQLEAAVSSIVKQTFRNFEFLIYDDGSEAEVAAFLDELAARDDRIRIFHGTTNQGLAHGLNVCIRYAKGIYLARMDADDISVPERLQRQYEFLETHPEYGFVGCSAKLLREEGTAGIRNMPQEPLAEQFLPYSPFIHPSVMFRREVFEQFGLYSEARRHLRCEDYELFMRLFQGGCRGYNIQEPLFVYREDRRAFGKRKYRYRVDEARLRYTCFRNMGLLSFRNFRWVVKPLIAGMIPGSILYQWKKREKTYGMSAAETQSDPKICE